LQFILVEVVLPDLITPGLRLVICGTAAGTTSAREQAYYAGPGNKFWTVLYTTGLVDQRLAPASFRRLPEWGIGLTDVCKTRHGMDHELGAGAFDPARLWAAVEAAAPRVLAFNGKAAAKAAFELRSRDPVAYGRYPGRDDVWVLPSTSGAANGSWDETVWRALAAKLRDHPGTPGRKN
jgi:TDG/mug DNA glycosylase family protein